MSARDAILALQAAMNAEVLGQPRVVERMVIGLLADGHLLIEGLPGLAKTRAVKAMAKHLKADFSRIQFTPDLLPSDVTGTDIYYSDGGKGEFRFQPGPVFGNVLLADEINRAPAKVQAALLEAMEERQVTVGQQTHALPDLFIVMATQNPIEQGGTYRLPEAQLDRFMIKTSIGYPDEASTLRILQGVANPKKAVDGIVEPSTLLTMSDMARGAYVNPLVFDYIMRIVEATRRASEVRLGVSVRGALALSKIAMTWAVAHGRTYVTPDDVRELTLPALAHRLILEPEAEFDGVTAAAVVGQILIDVVPPSENGTA
jgi:MoxR-like ATPase